MKVSTVISIASLAVAAVGTIYSIVSGKQFKKLCERLDTAIDDLKDENVVIDISDSVVNEAVERMVSEQVSLSVPRVEAKIRSDLTEKITSEVRKEINASYADIKTNVAREIKEQIGHIDISEVKKQVVADAKEEAAHRFQGELDSILDKFNGQLTDLKAIYSSIAKSLSGN